MRIILTLLISLTFYISSDDHDQEDKAVLAAVAKYYAARTAEDFKTQVAMESKNGVYSTNSDGSFHKPVQKWSVEDYERNRPLGLNHVFFPEAVKLADNAYFVRFYYEGVVGENDAPYRTRVTTTWVKEMGKWVLKTQHYSSAAYGGVHQTTRNDFED
jgi:hypothetical protein|tara:strand:- start:270 stop:743 length:474 start_codon:yes stop_codon:yes gene_type:complete